ncbi:MAG TPA: molybdenum cofactor biosynthesis protein MoaE [Candidatus Eremiobacteraceae bacterium]|nr:molybdenum cofactor biosynthesis protein MoaE [Candidatus Eremiobacteraceae bacterium]
MNETGALESLDVAGAGGIVTFTGRVRAQSRGREVTSLEYEAYPEMVELVLAQIGAESKERFAIGDIVIHHRVGTLAVGEISVVIAVAAPHRTAAFDAASYAIDRLKQIAPIWKKEHSPDGAVWIEDRP